jgi:hypothetical protein
MRHSSVLASQLNSLTRSICVATELSAARLEAALRTDSGDARVQRVALAREGLRWRLRCSARVLEPLTEEEEMTEQTMLQSIATLRTVADTVCPIQPN